MSSRYFAYWMPSRSTALRNSSGAILLSCAIRGDRALDRRVVDAHAGFLGELHQRALGDHPLEHLLLEHVGWGRRDLRLPELHQHGRRCSFSVVLRDRLVVDDRNDRDPAALAAGASWACGAGRAAVLRLRLRRQRNRYADRDASGWTSYGRCGIVKVTRTPDKDRCRRRAIAQRGSLDRRKPGTLRRNRSSGLVPRRASPVSSSCTYTDVVACWRRRRQAMQHHAHDPAVGIVLKAHQRLQRLALDDRVVPAAEERPLRLSGHCVARSNCLS